MTQPVWDPGLYHRFGDLRLRPALELLARVSIEDAALVHDIGTGGGEIARLMEQRWPHAHVIGSDGSAEMLTAARAATPESSRVEWRLLDLNDWSPGPEHDVIYANAVLHWLPDHGELFPRLLAGLRPGGELAVQMPMSWWQPSHQMIRETLRGMHTPEADALAAEMAQPNVATPDVYYDILRPVSSDLDVWTTEYQQILTGEDPVFDWVSGSILRPVFARLPSADADRFSRPCRAALQYAYPKRPDGSTLFPFRRIFVVARR